MSKQTIKTGLITLTCLVLTALTGCSEGMFWRTGNWSPWVRQKWEEEEQIASTLFSRRDEMTQMVNGLGGQASERSSQVAEHLSKIARTDSVLLSRLHAIDLLSKINSPIAAETLRVASKDRNTDIRIAAVNALGKSKMESSVVSLQEVLGSDLSVDVRLAATRALGSFAGEQSVKALAMALDDKNPALQVTATESLARVTGQKLGPDVFAWRDYIGQTIGTSANEVPAVETPAASTALGVLPADLPLRR